MQSVECSKEETINITFEHLFVNVRCSSHWGNEEDNIWYHNNWAWWVCVCATTALFPLLAMPSSFTGNQSSTPLMTLLSLCTNRPTTRCASEARAHTRTHTQLKKDSGERSEQVRRSQGILLPELIESTYGSPAITLCGPVTVNSKH